MNVTLQSIATARNTIHTAKRVALVATATRPVALNPSPLAKLVEARIWRR